MSKNTLTIKAAVENARTGLRLRALRISKGIKMKWVADQIGCTESNVSLLETGKRSWSDDVKSRYLKAIGEA